MMTRPRFVSPTSLEVIRTIRNEHTTFRILQDGNDDLLLEVRPSQDESFRFIMEYTADLASGINLDVMYTDGYILFTDPIWDSESDTEDFDVIMRFTELDYTVPMVEDIEECPVCYESYEPMYGSRCGHHVCLDCMKKMDVSGIVRCPLCRSEDFKFPVAMACNRVFVRV